MVFKTEVKIDDFGRIVIPSSVRKKFMLKENEYLKLESDDEKIILRKKIIPLKYKNIIDKLIFLEKNYNLSLIMIDNNEVIYTSDKYKDFLNKKINKDLIEINDLVFQSNIKLTKNDILKDNFYCFSLSRDSIKLTLFVEENEFIKNNINLIYELLK